jgi:hypothetical protein
MAGGRIGAYELDNPLKSPYKIVGRHDSNPYAARNLATMNYNQ